MLVGVAPLGELVVAGVEARLELLVQEVEEWADSLELLEEDFGDAGWAFVILQIRESISEELHPLPEFPLHIDPQPHNPIRIERPHPNLPQILIQNIYIVHTEWQLDEAIGVFGCRKPIEFEFRGGFASGDELGVP